MFKVIAAVSLSTLIASSGYAQQAPRLGCLRNLSQDWEEGVSSLTLFRSGSECALFLEETGARERVLVNVNGRQINLQRVGRSDVFRSADRATEVRLSIRYRDSDGGDCSEASGNMTVAQRGRRGSARVVGRHCSF